MKRKPTRIIYYTYFVSYTISYIYHNTAIKFIHFKRKIQEYHQSLIIKKDKSEKVRIPSYPKPLLRCQCPLPRNVSSNIVRTGSEGGEGICPDHINLIKTKVTCKSNQSIKKSGKSYISLQNPTYRFKILHIVTKCPLD